MLHRLALLSAALGCVDGKGWGVWKDPHHYVGHHSYAGMRFVSESPPHVLTMVGLDDPSPDFESWWTLKGYCEDGPNGPMTEITFDFSPKGGPKKMTGKFTDNGDGTSWLVWPDGSKWEWVNDPLKPDPEHMDVLVEPEMNESAPNVLVSPSLWSLALTILVAVCSGAALAAVLLLKVASKPAAGGAVAPARGPMGLKTDSYHKDLAEEAKIKGYDIGATPDTASMLSVDVARSDGAPPAAPVLSMPSKAWLALALLVATALSFGLAGLLLSVSSSERPLFETIYDMNRGVYKGTVMVPLEPKSHVFTHGFDTEVPAEYSIFQANLPLAAGEQTHEIYFDEWTMTAFITVVTSSRLIQVHFDEDGRIAESIREWTVGDASDGAHAAHAGLHNVAHSDCYPGHLWLSTETDDKIYLVDSRNQFTIKYTLHVPTRLVKKDGSHHIIGGPHSVREGPDCDVWAMLKGSNSDGPGYDDPKQAEYMKHLMEQHFIEEGEPVPDSWAVWKVDPEKYDPKIAPAKGGVLFEALESPTMATFDSEGNAWITQDRVNRILHVSADGVATQVGLPALAMDVEGGKVWSFENGNGPGVSTCPDGSVWLANLGSQEPWLVRFMPGSTDPLIFKDLLTGGAPGDVNLRTIHIAFSERGGMSGSAKVMYVLTSSLLAPDAPETVIVQEFTDDWSEPVFAGGEVNHQKIVLPSTHSAAHRIAIAENIRPRSILVTGLLTNVIYQITGRSI